MGTWSSNWFAILVNLTDSFFWSCGCIAFNTSSPFSRKNRFVASAKKKFRYNLLLQRTLCYNSYSIFCCFWRPLQYSFEPFSHSNSTSSCRRAYKFQLIFSHSKLFPSSQRQHHLKIVALIQRLVSNVILYSHLKLHRNLLARWLGW